MNRIEEKIREQSSLCHKMLAVLLDPENLTDTLSVKCIGEEIAAGRPDFVFIGGSTYVGDTTKLIRTLREYAHDVPIVLFPGHPTQFSSEADAVLFLSLISGDNPDALIGWHVESARAVRDSGVEAIPMGYILVGDANSSTARVTHTHGIAQSDVKRIADTAIAGELLGMRLIYLEAGSGAGEPLQQTVIRTVKRDIKSPLIVGGGIHTAEQARAAWQAGADIVVVGNHLEQYPEDLKQLCEARNN